MMNLHTLVLYKSGPAIITAVGTKFEITLRHGRRIRVREKDILLLHPGPLKAFSDLGLSTPTPDVPAVQELLSGTEVTLKELAEWLYDAFTPATAWETWQFVADGLYFSGTPNRISVHTSVNVRAEQAAREEKIAENEIWSDFLARVNNQQVTQADAPFMADVEALARGHGKTSRLLRALKLVESPEAAHKLLLDTNFWEKEMNPYPLRLGLSTTQPSAILPDLPEEDRVDLTHMAAFAIDDAGSNDPDDAISWDGEMLWVHIADAAALIPENSDADTVARARSANLYLPDKTISMLPSAATQTLALGLSEISPTLSFALRIEADGTPMCMNIQPSWVRVTRLSYVEAEEKLFNPELAPLWQLAEQAQTRRINSGAIELALPEVKVRTSDAGAVVIRPLLPLRSRTLVREVMLLCGEALARFAIGTGVPLPFSVQPAPDFPENLPAGLAGMFARRRYMKGAVVTTNIGGHAGLGLPHYTQATSPLRRYGDLVVHQQLRRYLRGETPFSEDMLLTKIATARETSREVRSAERLSNQHWKLIYFLQNPQWYGTGVVVEKQGRRHTIILPDLDFEFRQHLRKDVPLNATVSVTVSGVDLPQLQAFFNVTP